MERPSCPGERGGFYTRLMPSWKAVLDQTKRVILEQKTTIDEKGTYKAGEIANGLPWTSARFSGCVGGGAPWSSVGVEAAESGVKRCRIR